MMYHVGLFVHMTAIMLIGGGSIGAIVAERQLWKEVSNRSKNARNFVAVVQSATIFIYIGMIMFIVSGVVMLSSVNWAFLKNPWFVAKLAFFVCLPLRGALIGRPIVAVIGKQLKADEYNSAALARLKFRLKRFHFIQFLLVAVIIFLVIFKV